MTTLNSKDIKAVRKVHTCEQCNTKIDIGQPAHYQFGIYEGNQYSLYDHAECHAAAREFAELKDLWWEDYPWFQYMEDADYGHHSWLLENHPIVAERLNIEAPMTGGEQ